MGSYCEDYQEVLELGLRLHWRDTGELAERLSGWCGVGRIECDMIGRAEKVHKSAGFLGV